MGSAKAEGGLYPPRLVDSTVGLIERVLPSNRPMTESSSNSSQKEVIIGVIPLPEKPPLSIKEQLIRYAVTTALADEKWKGRPQFESDVEEVLDDAQGLFILRLPEAFFDKTEIRKQPLSVNPK
jgi:hypothetical protein